MRQMEHANEELNRRSLFLRLRRELWLIPAATAAGALVGALLYSAIWLAMSGQRQYRQISKYYLTFGTEENGEAADYYNDYTWNDLIWSVPAIADVIEADLPEGMTAAEAKNCVRAEILSDVRLLTIEVTSPEPDDVQQLTNAVEDALVRYGKTAIQFENIEFLSSGDVDPVILSDRTRNAVLLGAVLGLIISGAFLWIHELLNDGIYVPEDALQRYGIPALLVFADHKTEIPDFLKAETEEEIQYLKNAGPVSLVGEDEKTVEDAAVALEQRGISGVQTGDAGVRKASHVLVVIPFGKANGTRTEHLLDRMKEREIAVEGCVLVNADGRFLADYYGRQKSKQSDRPA